MSHSEESENIKEHHKLHTKKTKESSEKNSNEDHPLFRIFGGDCADKVPAAHTPLTMSES